MSTTEVRGENATSDVIAGKVPFKFEVPSASEPEAVTPR